MVLNHLTIKADSIDFNELRKDLFRHENELEKEFKNIITKNKWDDYFVSFHFLLPLVDKEWKKIKKDIDTWGCEWDMRNITLDVEEKSYTLEVDEKNYIINIYFESEQFPSEWIRALSNKYIHSDITLESYIEDEDGDGSLVTSGHKPDKKFGITEQAYFTCDVCGDRSFFDNHVVLYDYVCQNWNICPNCK